MDFPIWDLKWGGGLLVATVAVFHVIISHFAIGAGFLLALAETRAFRHGDLTLRAFARRGSGALLYLSAVLGAISGVGIWFTIGLVHPAATSSLIHNFVWAWAVEWCFFLLEMVMLLVWVATWNRVAPRTHLLFIWLYFVAAFLSLVVIQGILAFMLTPGRWIATHSFWDGLFNPSYLPGLLLRTGVCLVLGAAGLSILVPREDPAGSRGRVIRLLAGSQLLGAMITLAGLRWWNAELPGQVRALYSGQEALLPALHRTELLALLSLGVTLLIGVACLLRPRLHGLFPAALAVLAAGLFLGSYERVREGARKPFIIRDYMYGNGVLLHEVGDLNRSGILGKARFAARESDGSREGDGRAVFRVECAPCHTLNHYLPVRRLLGSADLERIQGLVALMREDAATVAAVTQSGQERVAMEALNFPIMPPLVGTDAEADALGAYLFSLEAPSMAAAEAAQP